MKPAIQRIFDEIVAEIRTNEAFRDRLERVLASASAPSAPNAPASAPRARNRRARAVLDPYREYSLGDQHLMGRLRDLSVEQLKDIVSEHALDSTRLALKWRSAERLIELIVTTVRSRLEKGDGFRAGTSL